MSANPESTNPKVENIIKVKNEISSRLEKLNKALLSNDVLFLQLSALAKKQEPKPELDVKVQEARHEDNASDINSIELDLENNLKEKRNYSGSEEEED